MTDPLPVTALLVGTFTEPDGRPSYEHQHFLLPAASVFRRQWTCDFGDASLGDTAAINETIVRLVDEHRPDVVLCFPRAGDLLPATVDRINAISTTVGYFFDDVWRRKFALSWASRFKFVTTTDVRGVKRFRDAGYQNAIFLPYGAQETVYRRSERKKVYDVSFVGLHDFYRAWVIRRLRRADIEVQTWGVGWSQGPLAHDRMVEVFNESRINLNLSNSMSWDARYLLDLRRPVGETLRVWRTAYRAVVSEDFKDREQVKGRHFEINSCGGFQLSYYVEGLEQFYTIGQQIAIFMSIEDLVEKVQYYLRHTDEREGIAEAGYARTLADHRMTSRLRNLILQLPLSPSAAR